MASPPHGPASDDVARTRWMTMQAVRLGGFALAILGILVASGAVDIAGENNQAIGYLLIVVGLVDGFVVPQVLARKWRTPRP